MPPRTGAGSEVTTTGVPLSIGERVVIRGTQVLDTSAPGSTLAAGLVRGEVQVPELQLGLARRTDGGEHDVTAARRPANGVARPCGESLERFEVALGAVQLVEADVRLDRDTRTGVAEVGITA